MLVEDISGIYKIMNLINGKVYVGQSCHIYTRWAHHRSALRHNSASNQHLQQAWNKYGEDNFIFEVIEECDVAMLDQREIFWIDKLDSMVSGYNMTNGGGGVRGYKIPPESVQKMRAANTGKVRSEETIQRNRAATKKWYENHISASSIEVVCLNTGEHFENAVIAGEKYDVRSGSIRRCCNGELRSAGRYKDERLVWADAGKYATLSDTETQELIDAANRQIYLPVCINTGEVFETATIAASKYNISASGIRACCRGERHSCGERNNERLAWTSYNKYKNMSKEDIDVAVQMANAPFGDGNSPNAKRIICLNTGEIFASSAKAAHRYNIRASGIRRCCTGELLSCGEYNGVRLVWANYSDYIKMTQDEIARMVQRGAQSYTRGNNGHAKKVVCVTTGDTFDCITDAAEQTNTNINSLIACCKGRRRTAGGKVWRYLAA